MIPIDCKKLITFPYTCLFALFERSLIIISWRAPNKSLLVNPLASNTSHSLFFSPLRSVINREQHENHLNNQTSHCKKYGMPIIKAHTLVIDIKVGVSL